MINPTRYPDFPNAIEPIDLLSETHVCSVSRNIISEDTLRTSVYRSKIYHGSKSLADAFNVACEHVPYAWARILLITKQAAKLYAIVIYYEKRVTFSIFYFIRKFISIVKLKVSASK